MSFTLEPGKHIIITLEQTSDRRPWPIIVDEEGHVTSGLGLDDGATLIGFGPRGEYSIDVWPKAAVEDPESVVGLVATFGKDGGFFEWAVPIRELVVQ